MDENRDFTGGTKRKIFRLIFIITAMFLLSFAVFFLWNTILPQTIHVRAISYWQALGLLALSRLLFGNFNFGLPWGRKQRTDQRENQFMNMSEKDKTSFKEEWRKRFGNKDHDH